MALIEAPSKPLRDVRLPGPMAGLVRIIATARMLAAMAMIVTYFQTWHVVYELKTVHEPEAAASVAPSSSASGAPSVAAPSTAATDQAPEVSRVVTHTGFSHYDHSVLAPLLAAAIFALAFYLFQSPSLSRGMLSAGGTALLSILIFKVTFDLKHYNDRVDPKFPQALFGIAFITLALTAFGDLVFHPILYMWARRDQTARADAERKG